MLIYRRGKRKVIADYKFEDIYKFYKEQYKEKALPKAIVRKIYSKIFPAIVKLMVFENFQYRMPKRLGYLSVKKKEVGPKLDSDGKLDTRTLSVNWKKTKQLWQEIYPDKTEIEIKAIKDKPLVRELNEHSNGYRCLWYWDKTTCNIKNQNAYYIDMTRTNDHILSNGIKYNNLNFYI
jgi:hypothetical protein